MYKALSYLFALALILQLACCKSKEEKLPMGINYPPTETPTIKLVSSYAGSKYFMGVYHLPDYTSSSFSNDQWKSYKDLFLKERTKLLQDQTHIDAFVLIGMKDKGAIPDIRTDSSLVWQEALDNNRLCILDNITGSQRFCFGIRNDLGYEGDWTTCAWPNELNQNWEILK